MIFNWYADGVSASGIVKQLNALQIMPPSVYNTMKGCKGFAGHSSGGIKRNIWSITSINTMLKDEVYIGNLVQGKFKSASYRTKKMVPTDESEWTVIEGTHEAIITDDIFSIVHDRFARHTRVAPNRHNSYLLSGFVKCARCGGRMNRNASAGQGRFRCMTRVYSPEKCQCPSVKESVLEEVVLNAIQGQIQELVDAKSVIEAARQERPDGHPSNEYTLAIKRVERELKRLEDAKFRLYDNLEKGIIDEDEYIQFKRKYTAEIEEQRRQIQQLQASMADLEKFRKQDDEFVAFFERYGNINVIDRSVLERLLDHVEVVDGSNIAIYFKFSAERKKILDFAKNIEEAVTDGIR